jgi:hypothetical protein
LQPNLADYPVSDFQHWPSWRRLVIATAAELTRFTGSHLIAPQTVLDRPYLQEIVGGLRALDLSVFHVVLDADEAALRTRIEGSDEATQWRLDHLAPYRAARSWLIEEADLVVDTAPVRPAQAAQLIARRLSGIEALAPSPVG